MTKATLIEKTFNGGGLFPLLSQQLAERQPDAESYTLLYRQQAGLQIWACYGFFEIQSPRPPKIHFL